MSSIAPGQAGGTESDEVAKSQTTVHRIGIETIIYFGVEAHMRVAHCENNE